MLNTDLIYGILAIVLPLVETAWDSDSRSRRDECPHLARRNRLGYIIGHIPVASADIICNIRTQ